MAIRGLILKCLVGVAVACVAVPALSGPNMYRYRDEDGVLVVDFSVPPQYVLKGYEVITPSGRVVREVPPLDPGLTAEVLKRREEQKKEDEYILRSYSTLEDIERARTRKQGLIEREITILESNVAGYALRRDELRERAADYQASGRGAPESFEKILAEIDVHEQNTKRLLAERRVELEETKARFQRYAERLVELRPSVVPKEASNAEVSNTETVNTEASNNEIGLPQ